MGKAIAIFNQKGGVGKTTTNINLAAGLAHKGKEVLMVDIDPQGNTTSGIGIRKRVLKHTLYDALIDTEFDVDKAIVPTNTEGLFLLPASVDLAGAEGELAQLEGREGRLKRVIDAVKDDYDYILVDCPPSLGMLTVNSFAASDGVIVPMQCEFYALEGLSQLMITINRIKRLYNPELSVSGILITMYNGRLLLSMQVISELKKHYEDKIFETKISRNVKLTEAPGFGRPAYYHDKSSKGAKEYLEVAKELVTRI